MNERGHYARKPPPPAPPESNTPGIASICVVVGGALLVRSWLKR
jgi:hypothetical protein